MPEGPNKEKPSKRPTERIRIMRRNRKAQSDYGRALNDRLQDGTWRVSPIGTNRGKDLMSEAERSQILRNTQSQRNKSVKQRKGVVAKAAKIRGMKHPPSQTRPSATRKVNRKKK